MRACLPSLRPGFQWVVVLLAFLSAGPGAPFAAARSLFGIPELGGPSQRRLESCRPNDRQGAAPAVAVTSGGGGAEDPCVPSLFSPLDVRERPARPRCRRGSSGCCRGDVSLDVDASLRLKQFGYDMFSGGVDFCPGDERARRTGLCDRSRRQFHSDLVGACGCACTLPVDRGGQIVLPEVGALRVWGMKFGELESYLRHELSRKFTDFKMSIAMDRLRTIQVFVVGEATAPGRTPSVRFRPRSMHSLLRAGRREAGRCCKIRLSQEAARNRSRWICTIC